MMFFDGTEEEEKEIGGVVEDEPDEVADSEDEM